MTTIADILKVSVEQIRISTLPQYRIRSSSIISVNILRDYFNRFPPMSSKRIDYVDRCSIHDYMKNGTALEMSDKIVSIKAQMNNNQINFNWDHLKNG